jgi:hypothetical protein
VQSVSGRVFFFHALDPRPWDAYPWCDETVGWVNIPDLTPADIEVDWKEFLDALPIGSVPWETRTETGRAVNLIARYADTGRADLLVIGTEGRTGLSRLLGSSVAEAVVSAASWPVLVLSPSGLGVAPAIAFFHKTKETCLWLKNRSQYSLDWSGAPGRLFRAGATGRARPLKKRRRHRRRSRRHEGRESEEGLLIEMLITGLAPGLHAVHLNSAGKCEPPAFTSAGGHFNPLKRKHGVQNSEGPHAGDLPDIYVNADAKGRYEVLVQSVTLAGASFRCWAETGRRSSFTHRRMITRPILPAIPASVSLAA